MKFAKALEMALNILLHSKLRSWLTIIGIVIGVGAIVAIVSMGEGLQQSVNERLSRFGADIITISAGRSRAFGGFRGGPEGGGSASTEEIKLTTKDTTAIKSVQNIKYIHGTLSGRVEVYYLTETTTLSVTGVDPLIAKDVFDYELESGRFIGPADYNVVVIGHRIANDIFKQPLAINRMIDIEGKQFRIIGILSEGESDSSIYMPIEAAREVIEDVDNDEFGSITVIASDPEYVDQIVEDIEFRLMMSRHVTERDKDFTITAQKEIQEQITEVTQTMTLFLGSIAAVSLVVGAVGVANTQFTSVLEKTKDIGIMKAIGAKNRDIMIIFLFNSGLVGLVGGLLGIGLGTFASSMLSLIGLRLMGGGGMGGSLTTVITPQLLTFSLFFSIIIGVIAGVVPAYNASKLKPVDALRSE
jgi:putative ABC transport system permease protein